MTVGTQTVDVVLNGKPVQLPKGATVSQLLIWGGWKAETVAIQLNGDIPEKSRYDALCLQPGDEIEVVHFVGGG